MGFEDAEVDLKGDRALKQKASNSYRQAAELERESRLDYYCIVSNLAQNTKFHNILDEIVMVKHSDGATIKEIVDILKLKGISRDRKTIRYIIRRWQMNWGIKIWSPRQMNLKK